MYTPFKHEMVGIPAVKIKIKKKNTDSCLLKQRIFRFVTIFGIFQLQPNDYGSLNRTILTGMQNGNVDNNMNTM